MRSNPFALWLYIWWFLRRAKVFQWDGSGNSDRHGWTPVDFSVGFHPTNGFHRNPSNNISAFSDVHLTSDTLSRHDFRLSHFRWKVSGIDFCLFNCKKKVFHRNLLVCIGHIWRFSFIFPIACYRLRIGTRQLFYDMLAKYVNSS